MTFIYLTSHRYYYLILFLLRFFPSFASPLDSLYNVGCWLATNHHQAAYRAWACDEVLLLLLSLLLFGCIIYLFNSKISASTTATLFLAFCCLPLYDAADDDGSCGGAVVASAAAAVAPQRRPNVSYIHTILYGAEITYYTRHEAGFRCLHPLGLEVFFSISSLVSCLVSSFGDSRPALPLFIFTWWWWCWTILIIIVVVFKDDNKRKKDGKGNRIRILPPC